MWDMKKCKSCVKNTAAKLMMGRGKALEKSKLFTLLSTLLRIISKVKCKQMTCFYSVEFSVRRAHSMVNVSNMFDDKQASGSAAPT